MTVSTIALWLVMVVRTVDPVGEHDGDGDDSDDGNDKYCDSKWS